MSAKTNSRFSNAFVKDEASRNHGFLLIAQRGVHCLRKGDPLT